MSDKVTAILVDDEPFALERLNFLLQDYRDKIRVSKLIDNATEALVEIEKLKPDVVFMDIEMPGKTGLQLVKELEFRPAIVFVTAYDQYAVLAFEENSLDYLLKPVEKERLALTIERLLGKQLQQLSQNHLEILNSLLYPKKRLKTITIKVGDKINFVKVEDVLFLESKDKYVLVHTLNKSHLADHSLTYWKEQLPDNFLQIHRSYILNLDKVTQIQKYSDARFLFQLEGKIIIRSGSTFYSSLKTHLGL